MLQQQVRPVFACILLISLASHITLGDAESNARSADELSSRSKRETEDFDMFAAQTGPGPAQINKRSFPLRPVADSDLYDKRAREFVGKRFVYPEYQKRMREFVGKRDFDMKRAVKREWLREKAKRMREFVGKRAREFVGKRAREFVGKRSDSDNMLYPYLKRAREFVGKRGFEFNDIGDLDNGALEYNLRMSRSGSDNNFPSWEDEKRDGADDQFKEMKRVREFVGKRSVSESEPQGDEAGDRIPVFLGRR